MNTRTLIQPLYLVSPELIYVSLRVCLISLEVFAWGRYGGIGRATRDIAGGLARRGVDVHVVTPRYPGQRTLEELDGFTVHGHSIYGYPFTGFTYRRIDADIYHSQEPGLGTLTALNSVSGALHLVTCQNPRTTEDWERQQRYYGLRRRAYNQFMEPKVSEAVRRADAVFCQSKHIISKAKELYRLEQDPGFLPNPVDVPECIPRKSSEPTVCFLGRLDPEKNPEGFIELARASPDVRFIVAGKAHDPRRNREMRQMMRGVPNLEHRGFVEGAEKKELLDESWVLVNTSHVECLPVAFLEAAAHRCSILSPHDPDGFATRFGHHVTGDDYESGLRWLLEDERWREKGKEGYRYVSEAHEAGRVVDLHLEHYNRLVEEKATPRPWT